MSDIRVSVQWKSSAVFAGEDLECIITFKNVSQGGHVRKSPSPSSQPRRPSSGRDRWKESLPRQDVNRPIGHTQNNSTSNAGYSPETVKVHGPPTTPSPPLGTRQASSTKLDEGQSTGGSGKVERHRRSVSIVSIGKEQYHAQNVQYQDQASTFRRAGRSHARAASLQVLPRRSGVAYNGPILSENTSPRSDSSY